MRILRFVSLKIVEIGGFLLVLYLGSFYYNWIHPLLGGRWDKEYWMMEGVLGLMMLFITITVPGLIGIGIYFLVKKNWEWSK